MYFVLQGLLSGNLTQSAVESAVGSAMALGSSGADGVMGAGLAQGSVLALMPDVSIEGASSQLLGAAALQELAPWRAFAPLGDGEGLFDDC